MKHKVSGHSLSRLEISVFSESMAMMLKSGIQTNEAVSLICEDLNEGRLRTVLSKLADDIQDMYSVCEAINASNAFPKYFVDMVRVGETAGKLEQVFSALASYYHKENELEIRIRSAVIYPIIIISLMAAVVFFLIYNVLPIFGRVFEQLGGMTETSVNTVNIGFLLGNIAFYGIVLLLLVFLAIVLLSRLKTGKAFLARIIENLWFTKEISYQIGVSRLAYALATFISSGVNTDRAMELVLEMTTHGILKAKLKRVVERMTDGASMASAMASEKIFGTVYGKMLVGSMKSGAHDMAMSRLAEMYEQETSASIDGFISAIVPVSAACVTIIVGIVLASVMMPLIGIMTSLG